MHATTRKRGLRFLARRVGQVQEAHVSVSRFYPTDESWTRSPVWWFDLPLAKVRDKRTKTVYLLCEGESGASCRILKVPASFILRRLGDLCLANGGRTVRLHLSARDKDRFMDLRGEGRLAFARFRT